MLGTFPIAETLGIETGFSDTQLLSIWHSKLASVAIASTRIWRIDDLDTTSGYELHCSLSRNKLTLLPRASFPLPGQRYLA